MANIPAIIIANGSAVMLLLLMLFSSRKTMQSRMPDNQIFLIMVSLSFIQCVIETVAFIVDGKPGQLMHIIVTVSNSLLFFNDILFAFMWVIYADYKLFSDMKRIKKRYPFAAAPAILVMIFSLVNMFTPVFFKITPENVYERTPLFYIPCVLTYIFLVYGAIIIYMNRSRENRYLFLPALLFMVPIFIGTVFQIMFYGFSLIWLGTAIALVSLHINVQNEGASIDLLSGVFTRQYMNSFLNNETRKSNQNKILAGIMLDIDRFKLINDKFGHLIGDDAIKTAGEILRSCVPSKSFIARFAGDEFVIIMRTESTPEIGALMQLIEKRTEEFNQTKEKPYSLCFSMGYSVFQPDDTVDSFLNHMDSAMYEDKNRKSLAATQGR